MTVPATCEFENDTLFSRISVSPPLRDQVSCAERTSKCSGSRNTSGMSTPAFAFLNRVRAIASRVGKSRNVEILGPAPQQMERKEGRYRAQLLLRGARRAPLHELLRETLLEARHAPEARKVRWSLDVDPIEL